MDYFGLRYDIDEGCETVERCEHGGNVKTILWRITEQQLSNETAWVLFFLILNFIVIKSFAIEL